MGDIQVGDLVIDQLGKPCSVVSVSDTQYRRCFDVEFDDGSIITTDDVHRWLTYSASELQSLSRADPEWRAKRRENRPSRAIVNPQKPWVQATVSKLNSERLYEYKVVTGAIRSTEEIARTLVLPSGRRNHAVPVQSALDLPEVALPVDPYLLGVFLGDGSSHSGSIGMIDADISEMMAYIPAQIRSSKLLDGYKTPFRRVLFIGLRNGLNVLGIFGSDKKRIPSIYKRASFDQRRQLLCGILDTDGYVNSRGQIELALSKRDLIEDAWELVSSLGIRANIRTHKTARKDSYRIKFVAPFPVFKLKRKLEKQKLTDFRRTTQFRYIVDVKEVSTVPTRCIAVDSPSRMYLVGHTMVPTHNTDLLMGAALTRHRTSIIFRREFKQLEGLRERAEQLYRPFGTFNGQRELWRLGVAGVKKRIEFGACQYAGDEQSYQGRAHDGRFFDEITAFTEDQFRFLCGWNRSSVQGQRSRIIAAGNPPRNAEGYWVINYWAPWLDPKHPNPAKDGELRYFAQIPGRNGKLEDMEVADSTPIRIKGERDAIVPQSRTFIRAFVQDNPIYMESGYLKTLQALPEPLRSQMLHGDFGLGHEDHPKQVVPTAWVVAAQARWSPDINTNARLDTLGVDIARGGKDKTVITPRHGVWFGYPDVYPGSETPDGWEALQRIIKSIPTGARPTVNVDIIGVGAAVFDLARAQGLNVFPMDARHTSYARDSSGTWGFANKRAEWWWLFREALDPLTGDDLALPPDRELLADLTAPRWMVKTRGIQVEDKEELVGRIGRSPDRGDSTVLAFASSATPIQTHLV